MTTRVTLRLDQSQMRRVDQLCLRSDRSRTSIVRFAVTDLAARLRSVVTPGLEQEVVQMLAAYRFDDTTSARAINTINADETMTADIDTARSVIEQVSGVVLTPNKLVVVAILTWLQRPDEELLRAMGDPYASRAGQKLPVAS